MSNKMVKISSRITESSSWKGDYASVGGIFQVPSQRVHKGTSILSQDQPVSLESEVVQDAGHTAYSIILGKITMCELL